MDVASFLTAYHEDCVNDYPALIHFRQVTRGDKSVDNCHPFKIKHGALIHNGTISGLGKVGVGKSDTQILADMLYDEDLATLSRLEPLLTEYLDYNRVAFMDSDGDVLIINKDGWVEHEGSWYSNHMFNAFPTWSRARKEITLLPSVDPVDSYEDEYYSGYNLTPEFAWEEGKLYVETEGVMLHDPVLEKEVLLYWHQLYGADAPTKEDSYYLYEVTDDVLYDKEIESWPSTPHVSSRQTDTHTA